MFECVNAHQARISLLTAEWLPFRDGVFAESLRDPTTGPVLAADARLIAELIERTERH